MRSLAEAKHLIWYSPPKRILLRDGLIAIGCNCVLGLLFVSFTKSPSEIWNARMWLGVLLAVDFSLCIFEGIALYGVAAFAFFTRSSDNTVLCLFEWAIALVWIWLLPMYALSFWRSIHTWHHRT